VPVICFSDIFCAHTQKPNPFSKSIYDNIIWGARPNGLQGSEADVDKRVEESLKGAAL